MSQFNFKLGKDALFISILTLLTVIVWMVMDIYRALNSTQIPNVLKSQTKPMDPKLPLNVIEDLEARVIFSPDQLDKLPNMIVIEEEANEETVEEPEPTITPTPTTEEEINTGTTATESAILE